MKRKKGRQGCLEEGRLQKPDAYEDIKSLVDQNKEDIIQDSISNKNTSATTASAAKASPTSTC